MANPSEAWTAIALEDLLTGKFPTTATVDALRTNQTHLHEILYDSHSPSVTTAWVALASTDTDADSPIDTTLADALVDRNENLYEALQSHVHDGSAGETSGFCLCNNLLHAGAAPPDSAESLCMWGDSGFSFDSLSNLWEGKTSGDYLKQIMARRDADSKALFGTGGMDCVLSMYVRSAGDQAAGELTFGFTDDSTSSFRSGESFAVAYTAIPTNWTRHYFRLTAAGAGTGTNVTFLCHITSSFTFNISVAGFMVTQGSRLAPFTISNVEGDISSNKEWDKKPTSPIFDEKVSLFDAVEAT